MSGIGINNPRTVVRLWAALYSDFETLMAKYMRSRQWQYMHFAKICREVKISLVLHVTQGRGKTKDEHYDRVTDMIFQICKDIWLASGDVVHDRDKALIDKNMELKRSLGGFFLLYTLYEKQPIQDRVKISLGVDDLNRIHDFMQVISELAFVNEITFMLKYLTYKKAFNYCVYAQDFRFDVSSRYFLNSSQNEVVDLIRRMRDGQDILAYSSIHFDSEAAFAKVGKSKNEIAKDILKTVQPEVLRQHLQTNSALSMFLNTLPTEMFRVGVSKLNQVVDKPVLTLQGLTATEAIDRRMVMETRQRMERARKKVVQGLDRDGVHKAVNPYVREGGIFGRKKEKDDEADDHVKKRERGACNGNLWIYINGCDFDKPMGGNRQKPPPMPTSSTSQSQ